MQARFLVLCVAFRCVLAQPPESPAREQAAVELAVVDMQAAKQFAANDCRSAAASFDQAVRLARLAAIPERLPALYRRLGICRARLGENEAALTAYREGVTASEAAHDNELLAENLHGAVYVLRAMARFAEALPLSEREFALVEHCGHAEHAIRALISLAPTLGQVGRSREGAARWEQALDLSRKTNSASGIDICLAALAMTYSALGDNDAGLRLMRELMARSAAPDAAVMNQYGVLLMRAGRDTEAEVALRDAVRLATGPNDWRISSGAYIDLAQIHHRHQQYAKARQALEGALQVTRVQTNPHIAGAIAIEYSQLALEENRVEEAVAKANEAVALERQASSFEFLRDALCAQGQALEAAGNMAGAEAAYREAISLAEAMRAGLPGYAPGLEAVHRKMLPAYQLAVRLLLRQRRAEEALAISEQAKSRILGDLLAEGEPLADAELAPAERAREAALRESVIQARKIAMQHSDGASAGALHQAQQAFDAFERELYLSHPELVLQRADFHSVTPEQRRDLLPRGSAILSYFELPGEMAIFAAREGELKTVTIPWGAAQRGAVRDFRAALARREVNYRTSAAALFKQLVQPVLPQLAAATHWTIAPDDVLWQLPFQALIDGADKHVLEGRAVSYAPSLTVLWHQRQSKGERGGAPLSLLAVGSESEVAGIARLYPTAGAVVLAGRDAHIDRFQEAAGKASVIHIATHAELDGQHPLESFLKLSPGAGDDGALTARRLMRIRLRAHTVVLSACETALGKQGSGEALMGLGWALAAAGSPVSIISQWKVDAAATHELMLALHRRLTAPTPFGEAAALRRAALETMSQPLRRHPFYWAGFVALGDAH
jgi:CHAT domain-containing protein/Flp pilus assembly protein TadD